MTTSTSLILIVMIFLVVAGSANAQSFTYQGKLAVSGTATNGAYDFRFRLYDAETGGAQQGTNATVDDVAVANGIFTVELDFGPGAIEVGQRWLEIEVRPGASSDAYNLLSPRQKITPAPYSTIAERATSSDFAGSAGDANTVGGISPKLFIQEGDLRLTDARQPLPDSPSYVQINPATVQAGGFNVNGNGRIGSSLTVLGAAFLNSSVSVGGTLSGNGSGLTNLNGANITPGSITAPALAAETFPHSYNLSLLGSLRWDLLVPRAISIPNAAGPAFDGSNIWVANAGGNTVTKVRASDGVVLGAFQVGTNPTKVTFDGSNVWVSNSSTTTVTKLRASDGALQGTFSGVNGPRGSVFDGANVWFVNTASNVTKIRASDGVVQGTFAVGANPSAIAFDGANIWVTNLNSDNVTKLRASDGALLGTFNTGGRPAAIVFDGLNIWIGNQGTPSLSNPSVYKLRVSDGALLESISTSGAAPVAMSFDGASIWVTAGNRVIKLRGGDGFPQGTYLLGTPTFEIAFDGANIWVTNGPNDTITKMPVFP
jgi:outer membrane lipoprotein-sorting protein